MSLSDVQLVAVMMRPVHLPYAKVSNLFSTRSPCELTNRFLVGFRLTVQKLELAVGDSGGKAKSVNTLPADSHRQLLHGSVVFVCWFLLLLVIFTLELLP